MIRWGNMPIFDDCSLALLVFALISQKYQNSTLCPVKMNVVFNPTVCSRVVFSQRHCKAQNIFHTRSISKKHFSLILADCLQLPHTGYVSSYPFQCRAAQPMSSCPCQKVAVLELSFHNTKIPFG